MMIASTLLILASRPLVTPNPSREAQALYSLMRSEYGKRIFSGQCDDKYLPFIKQTTGGKEPAIMGYDLNGIVPGQKGNQDAQKAIAWARRGGIVTFQWHWIAPNGKGDFYSKDFDLAAALANTAGSDYQAILRDIDLAAAEMKKLQRAGVPVIWRPLHEAEGKWFWWGMSGEKACMDLYRLIFDRFTKRHRLNNLIWTWTSYGRQKGTWWPGDSMVDLVVWDYEGKDSWKELSDLYGSKGYMLGLGEEGKLPDPDQFSARPWLYFLTWAYMIEDKEKGNTPEWIHRVYNDPKVITLSDMAALWKRSPRSR
jgi:mannan endo-1,4-beta-mannosidase